MARKKKQNRDRSLLLYLTSYFSKIASDDYQICKMKVLFVPNALNTGSYTHRIIIYIPTPYAYALFVLLAYIFSVWEVEGSQNHSKYLEK